jgi:hypothetical protein
MENGCNTGDPKQWEHVNSQPDARKGKAGLPGESDRLIVAMRRGNARRAKEPEFNVNVRRSESSGDW